MIPAKASSALSELPPVLNARRLGEILDISEDAARKGMRAGRYGPVLRDQRRIYVETAAFLEALRSRAEEPPPEQLTDEGRRLLRLMGSRKVVT